MTLTMPEVDYSLHLFTEFQEAPACESGTHTTNLASHDLGPATHYARLVCPVCGLNIIKAYCATFVAYLKADGPVHCECGRGFGATEIVTILEAIN